MKSYFTYDLLIIGGGISACVFASKYLKINPRKRIGLIEAGKGLGGRSSTRISRKFKGWKLNHGSPNLNICNSKNNPLIKNYIDELLEKKFIKTDDSEMVLLDEGLNLEITMNSEFSCGKNYLSLYSMSKLSQNIIGFNSLKGEIDFYFETLIVDLLFNKGKWQLKSKNGVEFKSNYLICSSNLLLHKRSIEIIGINKIPLRKAIPQNKDEKIDLLLNYLDKQTFIPRLTFLIYTDDYSYKDFYKKNYRYFYLKSMLEDKYKFERVIFQLQNNRKLGIVVHTKDVDLIHAYDKGKDEDLFKQKIFTNFNQLFANNSSINQLSGNEKMSVMKWRASQPCGSAVPFSLQLNKKYRIGFCGDWFEGEGFGRIEGSILSSLMLVNKFKNLN